MRYKCSILKCPTGRYTFVGSVPSDLCYPIEKKTICGADLSVIVVETEYEAKRLYSEYVA